MAKSLFQPFKNRFIRSSPTEEYPDVYVTMDRTRGIKCYEGAKALEDLINTMLKAAHNMAPMQWDECLYRAAHDHSGEMGFAGEYGHETLLGMSMYDRIREHS
jgi:uncharacterized protein YkwD